MLRNAFGVIFAFAVLAGCAVSPGQTAQPKAQGGKTFLVASALWGDPVFDNDVLTFADSLRAAVGGLAGQKLYGYTSPRTTRHDGTAPQVIADFAARAVDGRDVVVAMWTTHGQVGYLAVKDAKAQQVTGVVEAADLNQLLAPLDNDLQVVILQACFSGSLIDGLKHPNRIILTAAAKDRSSFGCRPNNANTWFIESMNAALAQGGSWGKVFATTKSIVRAKEKSQGIRAEAFSNPQSFIGANMRGVWRQPL